MTNHISGKYLAWAKRTKEAIEERFPQVQVFLKSAQGTKANPTILDQYEASKNLGALEVIMVKKGEVGDTYKQLYSKIRRKNWPRISFVLQELSQYLDSGALLVKLYDDDETKVTEEERDVRFEGVKLKLTCEFNNTEASRQLAEEVVIFD